MREPILTAHRVLGLIVTFTMLLAVPAPGQVLETVPDGQGLLSFPDNEPSPGRPGGLSLAGTTGLVTIPTSPSSPEKTLRVGIKGGSEKTRSLPAGEVLRFDKDSRSVAVSCSLSPNLEVSVNHLWFERKRKTGGKADDRADFTGGGVKLYTTNGKQSFCIGGHYSGISDSDADFTDLADVANLKFVYGTFGLDFGPQVTGFLSLRSVFPTHQKIALTGGRTARTDRKAFLVGAGGIEWRATPFLTLMFEGTKFDYDDIFRKTSHDSSLNGGLRIGRDSLQFEACGTFLDSDPATWFGLVLSL